MDRLLSKINPPSLVYYDSADEYRQHYVKKYVRRQIVTTLGVEVKFTVSQFNHAFYKTSIPEATYKDVFDEDRAERIDWIEYTLTCGLAEVYLQKNNRQRQLHILLEQYVVILNLSKEGKRAFFITAYLADSERHIKKLRTNEMIFKPQ